MCCCLTLWSAEWTGRWWWTSYRVQAFTRNRGTLVEYCEQLFKASCFVYAQPGGRLKISYFPHAAQLRVLCGSSSNSLHRILLITFRRVPCGSSSNSLHSILLMTFMTTSHSAICEERSEYLYMMYALVLQGLIYLSSYNWLAAADNEVFGIDLKPFTGHTSL
jgi:hypothetical protein